MNWSKYTHIITATALGISAASAFAVEPAACTNCFAKRWVYFGGNLAKSEDVATLKTLIASAKTNGFNAIAVSSGGYGAYSNLLKGNADVLRANLKEVTTIAQNAGIELIPVGGGPEIPTFLNPALVEALPVNDTVFTANAGKATVQSNNIVANGDFETATPWDTDTAPGNGIEATIGRLGTATKSFKLLPVTDPSKPSMNSRLMRTLENLAPHKAYRMSFWLKASNYKAPLKLQILPHPGTSPVYLNASSALGWGTTNGEWNLKGNTELLGTAEGWKQYNLDFNTGNYSTLRFYLGTQSLGEPGSQLWVDDIDIRQIGLAHRIDRPSLPVTVKANDDSVTYLKGPDYEIEAEALTIPSGSRIANAQKLKVSWYQSGENMASKYSTAATICTGEYFDTQKKFYDQLHNYFGGQTTKYFMYYDEIRLMNWDPSCSPAPTSAGDYLGRMTRGVQNRLLASYPALETYVWNDMFDPNMNAVEHYHMVNGDLRIPPTLRDETNSLHKNTVIVNWTGGSEKETANVKREASLNYFAAHKQIVALYYDKLDSTDYWLESVAKAIDPTVKHEPAIDINGIMYTTWGLKYDDLPAVAAKIRAKFPGRWPN